MKKFLLTVGIALLVIYLLLARFDPNLISAFYNGITGKGFKAPIP